MLLTGKKIEAAIKIMKIAMEADNATPPRVATIIHYSDKVATMLTNNPTDAINLAKAIVERMVTITAEAK